MTLDTKIKVTTKKELEFPIMLKQMTDKETKEYHLKRLYELISKSHLNKKKKEKNHLKKLYELSLKSHLNKKKKEKKGVNRK